MATASIEWIFDQFTKIASCPYRWIPAGQKGKPVFAEIANASYLRFFRLEAVSYQIRSPVAVTNDPNSNQNSSSACGSFQTSVRAESGVQAYGRTNATHVKKEQDGRYNRIASASTAAGMMLFARRNLS